VTTIAEVEALAGQSLFDYQVEALLEAAALPGTAQRTCLYYKTGAGKSITALGSMLMWGHSEVLVIAPPATHHQWEQLAERLSMNIDVISHARFRMPGYKLSRTMPVIADEMHLFGGHDGKGWRKLDQLAMHLKAPMVLASATPNYNDADRVYCIEHILAPQRVKGGFLQFIYQHCETEQNPFGQMPKVLGFLHHPDAASYLAAMPGVSYLPDDLVYTITDIPIPEWDDVDLEDYGYDSKNHRVMASQIEERHTRVFRALVNDQNLVQDHVYRELETLLARATTPVLVFSAHSTVANALNVTLGLRGVQSDVVVGDLTPKQKRLRIEKFLSGDTDVLVGTATLATGTDGMDKVCDWLIIIDDTDDDALRRQLVGRIMPRGLDTDVAKKKVYRLVRQ
jgi:superfamily II DNA or RNA helicase